MLLDYGGQLSLWHFALGGLVFVVTLLELWQDKQGEWTTSASSDVNYQGTNDDANNRISDD
jgi:hypothetical protein